MMESSFIDHWGESMPGTGDLNGKPTVETRLFINQQEVQFFVVLFVFVVCFLVWGQGGGLKVLRKVRES